MIFAISATIAVTTLGILLIGEFLGGLSLIFSIIIATILILVQWAVSPKIIQVAFKLVPADKTEHAWLTEAVENIAKVSGLRKPPKVYVSPSKTANAFAFGNIFSGKKVAVTRGLLEMMPRGEIEAVLAHELGHVKHRDVEIMMALSILPAVFYLLARWIYYASWFGGGGDSRDNLSALLLVAFISYIFYFITSLFMLWVSRIREFYADENAVKTVDEGNILLARALARLEYYNTVVAKKGELDKSSMAFKCLMISNPEGSSELIPASSIDQAVYRIARRKVTFSDRLKAIFSTHPLTRDRIKKLLSD